MASSSDISIDVIAAYHDMSDDSVSGNLLEASRSMINPDLSSRSLDFDTDISIDSEMSNRSLYFDSINEDLCERMLDFNSISSYSFDSSLSSVDGDLSDIDLDFDSVSNYNKLDNSIESEMIDSIMDFNSSSYSSRGSYAAAATASTAVF